MTDRSHSNLNPYPPNTYAHAVEELRLALGALIDRVAMALLRVAMALLRAFRRHGDD